ncbi:peptidase S1 [Salinarimonas ramus]|uniref:Peptidase S1 n=1 Tax=Salinarimonas ramus TaxID=690164 RepID=A0A917QFE6_9HYPH|nr:peptidase S1 [Salinarimonas ramus]
MAALAVTVPVVAQNYNRNPAFGTFRLGAGFSPDPYSINVRAGGTRNAAQLGSACAGSIADAPDVRIQYQAGSFPLSFTVRSNSDTTLVINDPNGRWYCDDDSAGNLDPLVRFNQPSSGQYDVWIGHYEGGSGVRARLDVSEY